MQNCFITTPIYYVNGKPHIGHAYTSIIASFLTSFYKKTGKECFLLTGTDEHGQKVAQSAQANGLNPQEYCDSIAKEFKLLAQKCEVKYNRFIRTTEASHKKFAQNVWQKLEENGWLYKGNYKGWYSVRDEAFYDDSEIKDGKAPTGAQVTWREEDSYFFRLSAFTEPLLEWFETAPEFVFPQGRFNEVKGFVKGGLKDLSVSRSTFNWGVEIPNTNHVMYVWIDALFNYHSALEGNFQKFWKEGEVMHIIGKDILRFHAIYWPALLTALKCTPQTLTPQKIGEACGHIKIISHGWWLSGGEKMSKSLGNTVDPFEIIQTHGADYLRYFLLREAQFGSDGNFTKEAFRTRITSELINNIGNLCQRTFTLLNKNCGGIVPNAKPCHPLLKTNLIEEMQPLVAAFKINQALEVIVLYASKANEFIQETKPWELFKQGKQKEGEESLYILLYVIFQIKEAIAPALPAFYERISEVFANKPFASGIKLETIQKVFSQVC